jgi:cobalt/nickel transport system permease protein
LHHAHIDKFAYQDSIVHRLDARVKLIAVFIFTVFVLMLPRTSVSVLACYAILPFVMLVLGRIPLAFVAKHILMVSPFIAALALAMPFYVRTPADVVFGPFHWTTTEGWLRCGAIVGKFFVTMAALIALVSTTRFSDLLAGMEKMGMPSLLVTQLGFLYRYIFVLIDRVHHMLRARAARRLRSLGPQRELAVAAAMIGSLLAHSVDSAARIGIAMHGRGFDGEFRTMKKMQLGRRDAVFAVIFVCMLLLLHVVIRPAFK